MGLTGMLKWVRTRSELGYSNGKSNDDPMEVFSDNHGAIVLARTLISHSCQRTGLRRSGDVRQRRTLPRAGERRKRETIERG